MLGWGEEEKLEPAAGFRAYGLPPPPEKKWRNMSIVFMVAMVLCLILFLASLNSYAELNNRYGVLNSEYLSLKSSYDSLRSSYDSLESSYRVLQLSYNIVESEYSSLRSSYDRLRGDYRSLQSSYSDAVNDRQVLLDLAKRLNKTSRLLHSVISIRKPVGEQCCSYITVDDSQLKNTVKDATGGWDGSSDDLLDDLVRMQEWVEQNIKPSYDTYTPRLALNTNVLRLSSETCIIEYLSLQPMDGSYWWGDFWRFPNETLVDSRGDCEDQAVLLTSMVRCYFKHYVGTLHDAYTIVISGPGVNVAHAAVVVPVAGGRLMILDPAGRYATILVSHMGRRAAPRPVEEAMNDYLRYWQNSGYAFTYVVYAFNEATYKSFNSLLEFVSWISR